MDIKIRFDLLTTTLTRIRLEFVADEGVQSVDSQRRCLERVSVRDDVVRLYADG